MATRILYRYDWRYYEPGDTMLPHADHITNLEALDRDTEIALRDGHPDGRGVDIRGSSLYAYADKAVLHSVRRGLPTRFYYELEVEGDDIAFESDLNYFNAVKQAISNQIPAGDAISQYWTDGRHMPVDNPWPIREVLFTEGKVLSRENGAGVGARELMQGGEDRKRRLGIL